MKKRKVFEVVLSLFLAIFLWNHVITVVTPEDDMEVKAIPIVYTNDQEMRKERGLLISGRTDDFVSVKFHGSRADLRRLERYEKDITAVVDTKTFTSEREYSSEYEIKLIVLKLVVKSAEGTSAVFVGGRSLKGFVDRYGINIIHYFFLSVVLVLEKGRILW